MQEADKPSRQLTDVIERMIVVVPKDAPIKKMLESIYRSAMVAAPEVQGFHWGRVADVLESELPATESEFNEWQARVVSIFQGEDGHDGAEAV